MAHQYKPHSLELRFYRFSMVLLLAGLTGIAGYIASTTVSTSAELPAIKQQLLTLNSNLEKLQPLPLQVQANHDAIHEIERRIGWLEARK